MKYIVRNASVYRQNRFERVDFFVDNGIVKDFAEEYPTVDGVPSYDFSDCYVFPGFADVHAHLREPGFSYKETIATGTLAAAHGGYTTVLSMPNLKPAPDTFSHLKEQLDIIESDACVRVVPYGTITKGELGAELSDMDELAPYVAAFSDDGRGVQDNGIMRLAMQSAKRLGKLIVAHCEDNSLLCGGYVHDGEFAKAHGWKGISSESEWAQLARDIELIKESGCGYHICHVSTKESVELIRKAKKEGLNITAETAPHYLLLTDNDLQDDGRFKMNPPIRTADDQAALIKGISDGTIDMIATDHAPHSAEEKGKGLKDSLMGIVGLETSFSLLYTGLVKKGIITLERLVELLSTAPRRRFSLPTVLEEGCAADFTVFALNKKYTIAPSEFLSQGKSTPFEGEKVYGECVATIVGGRLIYKR